MRGAVRERSRSRSSWSSPTPVGGGDVDVQELVRAVGALSFNQRAALVMRELEGRTYAEIAEVLEVSTSAVETLLFRARRALREQLEGTLTCGEAERVLSLELDGRLPKDERPKLRAHLRECAECASLARRQRARRAALRGLGPLPLPASLASWGGGAAVGGGVAVKVAALRRRRSRSGRRHPPGRRGGHRVAEARALAARRGRLGLEAHDAHDSDTRAVRPAKAEVRPDPSDQAADGTRAVADRHSTHRATPSPSHGRRRRRSQAGEAAARPAARAARGRGQGRGRGAQPAAASGGAPEGGAPEAGFAGFADPAALAERKFPPGAGSQEGMTPLLAEQLRADRSFERIYRKHVGDVYRYALAVLRQPADAEDVAQTTFLNAYRAYQRGERPRNAQNWLIAIAHNVCRQRFRQAQRRPDEVEFDDRVGDIVPEEERGPRAEDIQRALGHLAFNQRAALVMRELEGRSYAEIAEILETSVSAVETLLFRARRALREQLEGTLTCAEAERAISRQTDGRLARPERSALRAHLRQCKECERLGAQPARAQEGLQGARARPDPDVAHVALRWRRCRGRRRCRAEGCRVRRCGRRGDRSGLRGRERVVAAVASARGRRSRDDRGRASARPRSSRRCCERPPRSFARPPRREAAEGARGRGRAVAPGQVSRKAKAVPPGRPRSRPLPPRASGRRRRVSCKKAALRAAKPEVHAARPGEKGRNPSRKRAATAGRRPAQVSAGHGIFLGGRALVLTRGHAARSAPGT